ncbi:MAG: DUF2243 domain-containing protein [Actinomycetota bacterium]|nr:DUF2243 domain-containing protein [Actinomycetota bacterium]
MSTNLEQKRDERDRLRTPGILLGLGFGGFVDGIILHQVLQWHHMLTSTGDHPATTVKGLEANTLADGLFHGATWLLAVGGLFLLWNIIRRYDVRDFGRSLFGWTLAGWGIFNLVEGIVDHHILEIHHVRPGQNETLFDIGFLVLGALLLVVGVAMGRSKKASTR